jgi:hypothetical protein
LFSLFPQARVSFPSLPFPALKANIDKHRASLVSRVQQLTQRRRTIVHVMKRANATTNKMPDFHAEILIEQLIDLLCEDWALIIGPWFRRFPALMCSSVSAHGGACGSSAGSHRFSWR